MFLVHERDLEAEKASCSSAHAGELDLSHLWCAYRINWGQEVQSNRACLGWMLIPIPSSSLTTLGKPETS